jgi:hypothetical protein
MNASYFIFDSKGNSKKETAFMRASLTLKYLMKPIEGNQQTFATKAVFEKVTESGN